MIITGKRILLRKVYYALLLTRKGGLGIFLRKFWLRMYSKTNYVWLVRDLDRVVNFQPPLIRYSLQPTTPRTFRILLDSLNGENGQDKFEILRRISFYQRGFETCYIALTESGEICHLSWLLSARHNDLIRDQYPPGMRELDDGEILLENIFTFPPYRRKGIMTSVTLDLANIARGQGFRRVLAYVDIENKPSLRAFHRAGFRSYDEESEVRRFFRIWRENCS